MKSPLLKPYLYFTAFGMMAWSLPLHADSLTVEGDLNVEGNVGIGTASPTEKLEIEGNVKVNGTLTTTGTVTATSVTLPDGTLTSTKITTLYNAAGQPVATVGSDGKVNFANGVSIGSDPAATITPNSSIFLNQTLANLGFRENLVQGTPVKTIAYTGQVSFRAITQDASYLYVVSQVAGSGSIGGAGFSVDSGTAITKLNQNGITVWMRVIPGADIFLNSVAVDGSGNVIVAGIFSGTTTGLSSPASNLTASGDSDGMVVKYNASGASQWAQRVGGSGNDGLNSVAVDGSGNVIVAGLFQGTTTGLSSPASDLTASGSKADGMVVKYNAAGASQWAQRVGGSGYDVLNSVAVDGSGNVVVAGQFQGTTTGLSSPASNLTANGTYDGMVMKYNAAGASQWAQRVGGSGNDVLNSVAVDGSGNVVVAGAFSGTTTGLSSPASNLTASGSGSDGMVVKYNASGASQWARRVGGSSNDDLISVAVDGSGNVIVTGAFSGTTTGLSSPASNLTANGSGADGIVMKYDASGASQWAQRLGGAGDNSDSIDKLVILGNSVWAMGWVNGDSTSTMAPFGDSRIIRGSFVMGWSDGPVVTPAEGTPVSMAWGGSAAANTGVALGSSAYADGSGSAAVGAASAIAQDAFASGSSSARAYGATAMGFSSIASGYAATAIGNYSIASGNVSTAMGEGTNASGNGATAIGYFTNASGFSSIAMGDLTTASGHAATALGTYTTASGYAATALGFMNVVHAGEDPENPQPTDDLLVLGNGATSNWAPSNAFAVHRNGDVRVAGDVQTKGGFRTPPMGDLSMGTFTTGVDPAAPSNDPEPGLDAGLRYPGE